MTIAVIPARGGSKRIPRKNIRLFAGRPMIAWAIDTARSSRLFDHIFVSTDDEEIAEIARTAGAEVPFLRPASLSDDYATTADVIGHAVRWADGAGIGFEWAICLYPATPLLAVEDLVAARDKAAEGWDFVFAALRFPCPIERSFLLASNGAILVTSPEHLLTRTQDLPIRFHDAGQFYWGKRDAWLSGASIFGQRTAFIELAPWRAQDIDNLTDWQMAERLFKALKER